MRYRVQVSVYVNEYVDGTDQLQHYPLLDLKVRRSDVPAIIASAGLPMPPKSACWFCPFHRESVWIDMQREIKAETREMCAA